MLPNVFINMKYTHLQSLNSSPVVSGKVCCRQAATFQLEVVIYKMHKLRYGSVVLLDHISVVVA